MTYINEASKITKEACRVFIESRSILSGLLYKGLFKNRGELNFSFVDLLIFAIVQSKVRFLTCQIPVLSYRSDFDPIKNFSKMHFSMQPR